MSGQSHGLGRRVAVAFAAVAAVVGLWQGLSLAPDCTDRLRDDAFYEFAWAANVAAGRGPTASDGTTTSGVQLLWSLLLVPFAAVAKSSLPAIAAWLGFVCHVLAAWLIARGGRYGAGALVAALCWLGNPLLVRECQNGQETALACLLAVLLWLQRRAAEPRFLLLALLATFARTDLYAFVVALSLLRHGFRPRSLLGPVAVLLPFLAVNRALGGSLFPDSGMPMVWLWHANYAAAAAIPYADAFWHRTWWFLRPVLLGSPWAEASVFGCGLAVFAVGRALWPRLLRAVPAVAVGTAAMLGAHDLEVLGAAVLLLALFPSRRLRRPPRALTALVLGGAAILVLHWVVRWYPRGYYIAPLVLLPTAALLHFRRVTALLLVFPLVQIADHARVPPEPLAGQHRMRLAAQHLGELLPAGERIGCFNSGMVTWFAPAMRITNLDGVVDARALAALRERRLAAWLDEQGIRYVLDNPVQFATDPRLPHSCGLWFGAGFDPARDLREVARFVGFPAAGDRVGTDSFRLYWRVGRGAPPAGPAPASATALGDHWLVRWPAKAGEVLVRERADGTAAAVVGVDADTAVYVLVRQDADATGRLFVAGAAAPLLELPPL